jgi:hypothetical protein
MSQKEKPLVKNAETNMVAVLQPCSSMTPEELEGEGGCQTYEVETVNSKEIQTWTKTKTLYYSPSAGTESGIKLELSDEQSLLGTQLTVADCELGPIRNKQIFIGAEQGPSTRAVLVWDQEVAPQSSYVRSELTCEPGASIPEGATLKLELLQTPMRSGRTTAPMERAR